MGACARLAAVPPVRLLVGRVLTFPAEETEELFWRDEKIISLAAWIASLNAPVTTPARTVMTTPVATVAIQRLRLRLRLSREVRLSLSLSMPGVRGLLLFRPSGLYLYLSMIECPIQGPRLMMGIHSYHSEVFRRRDFTTRCRTVTKVTTFYLVPLTAMP